MIIHEKPLSYSQLLRMVNEELHSGGKMDFLAIPMTSWHAMGIMSVLLTLYESGKINGGCIAIKRYYELGWAVEENIFEPLKDKDIQIVKLMDEPKLTSGSFVRWMMNAPKRSDQKMFYCLVPQVPIPIVSRDLEKKIEERNIINIIVDEGLGTYSRSAVGFVHLCTSDLKNRGEKWNVGLDWMQRYIGKFVLTCKHRYIDCNLFCKRPGYIVKNNSAIHGYRRLYRIMGENIDFSDYSHYRNAMIISGQAYTSSGVMYQDEDIAVLKEICAYCISRQIPVVIKPHPREMHSNRYQPLLDMGCYLEENNKYPMELILANLHQKPRGIIGMTSTPLVTAKLFWDVPTYSIVRLLHPDRMRKDLRKEMRCFERKFGKYIKMIRKPEEII